MVCNDVYIAVAYSNRIISRNQYTRYKHSKLTGNVIVNYSLQDFLNIDPERGEDVYLCLCEELGEYRQPSIACLQFTSDAAITNA